MVNGYDNMEGVRVCCEFVGKAPAVSAAAFLQVIDQSAVGPIRRMGLDWPIGFGSLQSENTGFGCAVPVFPGR